MRRGIAERRQIGFTLVELGIVIGVIAVMVTIVFTARGFIDNGRLGSTLQLTSAIRDAARGFSLRQCGGASFNCDSVAGGPAHLNDINKLVGPDNFFTTPPEDPWGNGVVGVSATGAAFDFIDIVICIGQGTNSDELASDFEFTASEFGTVTIGGACGTGGTQVTVNTR